MSPYLEITSSSFLLFLAGRCVVHPFLLQMHQTKPFPLEGETERALVTFCGRLMGFMREHWNLEGSCKQL